MPPKATLAPRLWQRVSSTTTQTTPPGTRWARTSVARTIPRSSHSQTAEWNTASAVSWCRWAASPVASQTSLMVRGPWQTIQPARRAWKVWKTWGWKQSEHAATRVASEGISWSMERASVRASVRPDIWSREATPGYPVRADGPLMHQWRLLRKSERLVRRGFKTLIRETKLLNTVGADETRGQFVKGLEVLAEPLITQLQSAEVPHPAERPLDDVAGLAQPAAVLLPRLAVRRQQRVDPPLHHGRNDRLDPVRAVTLEHLGPAPRSTTLPAAGRDRVEHLQSQLGIRLVGRSGTDHQGEAGRVGHDGAFAALLAAVRGVRPGVRPPLSARTETLSITARSRLIRPRRPRTRSRRRCSSGQTPDCVQAWKRRQLVLPLPYPRRVGSICQGMPVLSTKMIPSRQVRLGIGGRPPLGEGLGSGSRGAIAFHNDSDTRFLAMVSSAAIVRADSQRVSTVYTNGHHRGF